MLEKFLFIRSIANVDEVRYIVNTMNDFLQQRYSIKIAEHLPIKKRNISSNCVIETCPKDIPDVFISMEF